MNKKEYAKPEINVLVMTEVANLAIILLLMIATLITRIRIQVVPNLFLMIAIILIGNNYKKVIKHC